jgi:DinB superfamily
LSRSQGELALRLARLERSRAHALALIEGKGGALLNRPPSPGKWSPLQVLHHVVTAEALTLAYIRKKQQAGAALPAASVASRLRLLLVEAALASPLRVRAPAVTADVPLQLDADGLRARWGDVRRELAALVEAFPPELVDRLVFRHPYAGRMTLAHALGTLQAHLDHHVRQVERALSASV